MLAAQNNEVPTCRAWHVAMFVESWLLEPAPPGFIASGAIKAQAPRHDIQPHRGNS
jgi:hypothetical protein